MISKRKYPWFGKQLWENIFFVHWRISPDQIKPYIPMPLKVDTFNGFAWISAVCFQASQSQMRTLPIDLINPVFQLNIRTYVTLQDTEEPGVYFFRLLLNNKMAVKGANVVFHLPFSYANANFSSEENEFIYHTYEKSKPQFHARFEVQNIYDDSPLAQFLTERYCIWNKKSNQIIKIPIIHSKWNVQRAKVKIIHQQIHPLVNNQSPYIVHYSAKKMSYLFPYEGFVKYGSS